jgi:ABC-2 type transport system ATP-binding protein
MAVLELSGVFKSFHTHLSIRRIQVLRDLSLSVQQGEIFGFIGTNGAGKTTTIKLALSFIFPDRGAVRLFGGDASQSALRRRIGYLPENPYFYDYLTGEEFLDFHARLFGLDVSLRRRRVRELLDRVGLGKRGDRQLRTYSKGMLQRIGLAQALVNDPELVILDEPMSGLDPIGRREVRDIILDLKARGRTVFFSTHILSDTEMICDRVGILVRGSLRAVGTIDDLLAGGDVPFWEVTLRGAPEDRLPCGRVVSRRRDQLLIRVDSQADVHRLLASVDGSAAVVSVVPARQSLEDLFIREAGTRAASAGAAPAAPAAGDGGAAGAGGERHG